VQNGLTNQDAVWVIG